MSFAELGLDPFILKALEKAGYTEPTPVQAEAIPLALANHDLLVSAQTGSGKTAAFMLPSLSRLAEPAHVSGTGPRVLVLTPTRELAQQVEQAARTYGKELRRMRTVSLVGGAPYGLQLKMLSQSVDVVVATPGRLMDHMERGRIDFARLEVLVLDEADRMLDMGFIDDIQAIVARTPATRQTLLFSATLDGEVGRLARELTREPRRIDVAPMEERRANIDQRLLFADNFNHKDRLLDSLLRDVDLNQAVVFTATKASAEDLSGSLRERGFSAEALHGDMPQHKRSKTLQRMRDGHTRILVATDVAARGIDVAGISHVINFDPPRQAEDYVHRIGRTGRAGRSGVAVTLVNHNERHLLRNIERYTGQSIRIEVISGLEPKAKPDPARRPRGEGSYRGKPVGQKAFRPRKEGSFGAQGRPEGRRPAERLGWNEPARSAQPAGEEGQPRTWKSRAELEYGQRQGRPQGQPHAARGRATPRNEPVPAYHQERERQMAYAKAHAKGKPDTAGSEYHGQRDRKHPDTVDKPRRAARYW